MFRKILIANRGEIACRIIRTVQAMGIGTVAVYSDADRNGLHVQMADEAVYIGSDPAAESYLRIDTIIEACRTTNAEAVHPGYGFLSENAEFCRRLAEENIVFIGPPTEAITAMGDKMTSKRIAAEAGVNCIPGYDGILRDGDHAVRVAAEIGYPVMLKATAGGGGKGMRIARNEEECRRGFERAASEARSSFGDDRMLIEKYIDRPRHVEIQIMADTHGNVIYLGERECSLQRRHQKIIEEAPSPLLDEKTRRAMGEQAVKLAGAVNYCSAGTVEFIATQDREFFFLEMNTRLQVEHPVTEMVTGLDLVELMVKVAAGESLPLTQDDIKLNGWAMESRIYAEDPLRTFLPSIGRLVRYQPPENDPGKIRVDTGVFEGGEISMYYDPMIAKLITWGRDREEAITLMQEALDEYVIDGVCHNVGFLGALMAHPRFREGALHTGFIEEEFPRGFRNEDVTTADPNLPIVIAAIMHRLYMDRAARISGQLPGHERRVLDDWVVIAEEQQHPVTVRPYQADCGYRVFCNGQQYCVQTDWSFCQDILRATIGDNRLAFQVARDGLGYRIIHRGKTTKALVLTPQTAELHLLMPKKRVDDRAKVLLAPMPGLLVQLRVEEGHVVKAGQELAVIEAMKMENVLRAAVDGVIGKVCCNRGDSLNVDQVILEFE
ncbi:MAG TPA: acetyl/propionyl/methylcrotonyl-CoA carboxylase subunit alpha [Desulfobulbaceae bacterium]|nr:acetyl/propionyl/methylcrotonyl-CoA carboxylase subunit alpha [Desulfobulbaceae bacterium]